MALRPRQARFVAEYLKDLNATQAAIRSGYSAKTAASIAEELLKKPDIAREVNAALERRNARVEVKSDDILRELLHLAMVDISEAYNPDGSLKPLNEIPADVRRSLANIETEEIFAGFGENREHVGRIAKVKFYDKTKALELLGKHLKLFTDKLEVSGKMTLEQLVEQAAKK